MQWIAPKELHKALHTSENWLIVDVREQYEWDICAIEALHIPMAEMLTRFQEIDKTKSIVVMCKSGSRAEAVANLMECELGFENLHVLEGGLMNWIAEIDNQLETY